MKLVTKFFLMKLEYEQETLALAATHSPNRKIKTYT